jgi:hypothetical protein
MSDELSERIRRSVDEHGASQTARTLGLSVEAVCRLAGGLPTQAGTRALAAANVGRLDALVVTTDARGYVVR